ncbi:hypothetical protein GH865_04110 [Rhodocyclus tenuis]|uniref:UPF0225 protein GHK24_10140 n=1 Tax=Rhodocyclus tenuis TaxID=1066 RepID=A0A6L5JZ71_RHOTE|nr:YchJ family metal-binding protein [Rhodocyclus gracilis]MQY52132.1 hypothetical protein [Rhodocyclus gracilis]MRD72438.1 hypothetical protein [Rhodocyclus gracilis]
MKKAAPTLSPTSSLPCPCHSARPYAECCGPLHAGAAAADAERLMRSRYAAYSLRLADYVLATWHESTRPASLDWENDPPQKWIGLDIRRHAQTGEATAEVEFIARCRVGGRAHRLHETSRFVCEAGRWYYVDGDVDAPAA